MLFTTPGQVIILAVLLLAGWLLGYASAPSVKKWKRKVRAQSDSFTAYHRDAEDKLRAATRRAMDLKAETDALRADHAEAERTIAALRAAAAAPAPVVKTVKVWAPVVRAPGPEPVVEAAPTIEHAPVAAAAPVVADAAPEHRLAAELAPEQPAAIFAGPTESAADAEASPISAKGWFGSVQRDDLTRIRAIDAALATRLFSLGVVRFADVEKLSDDDARALEQRLDLPEGVVARDEWRVQAAALRVGQDASAETAPTA